MAATTPSCYPLQACSNHNVCLYKEYEADPYDHDVIVLSGLTSCLYLQCANSYRLMKQSFKTHDFKLFCFSTFNLFFNIPILALSSVVSVTLLANNFFNFAIMHPIMLFLSQVLIVINYVTCFVEFGLEISRSRATYLFMRDIELDETQKQLTNIDVKFLQCASLLEGERQSLDQWKAKICKTFLTSIMTQIKGTDDRETHRNIARVDNAIGNPALLKELLSTTDATIALLSSDHQEGAVLKGIEKTVSILKKLKQQSNKRHITTCTGMLYIGLSLVCSVLTGVGIAFIPYILPILILSLAIMYIRYYQPKLWLQQDGYSVHFIKMLPDRLIRYFGSKPDARVTHFQLHTQID